MFITIPTTTNNNYNINSIKNNIIPNVLEAPNNIVLLQPMPFFNPQSIKWTYTIMDEFLDTISSAELLAVINSNGIINYSNYAKTGDYINYRIEPVMIDSIISIKIINLSYNNLIINLIRILI